MIDDPASLQARLIDELGWVLLAVCGLVFAGVVLLLARALGRTPRRPPDALRWVVGGGVVLPLLVLGLLLGYAVARTRTLVEPGGAGVVVTVIGHPWWWELHYRDPDGGATIVLANELHLPAGRDVVLGLTASDVIHSFWVPALGGKRDLLPGRTDPWRVRIDRPGRWRGQCAEFCGEQHARMALQVVAHEPARFEAWLRAQARPAVASAEPLAQRGRVLFAERRCGACHTVRGSGEVGSGGPDLTHLASRSHLAAGTLPMSAESLASWIADPQRHKPGARMPGSALAPADLQALAAYLLTLR
jgi:cytochrome c oxidase subunit 2